MKLREHLDKGVWAIADKGILLLYGFAVMVIVIGALPADEWGAFNVYQSIFLIICFIADSIFLQPMVKFASEHEAEVEEALGASFILYTACLAVCGLICFGMTNFLSTVLNSKALATLLPLLPIALALHLFRNIGIRYLQVFYRIKHIFWIDLAFFGSIIIISLYSASHGKLITAEDFVKINIVGGTLSSIVAFLLAQKGFRKMPLLHVPKDEYGKLLSFAKFQAGTSIMQQLMMWSDNLIISIYYSPAEVAVYATAKTFYRLFDAVREGATLLIVPVASRLHSSGDKRQLSRLVEQLLFLIFILLIPATLVLAVGSDQLMAIFKYDVKFPGVSSVFRILIASGFVLPLSLVATNVLIGMGKAKGLFLSMLGGTIVFFGLSRILVPSMASTGAAIAVLASIAAIGIFSYASMRRELGISAAGIIRNAKGVKTLLKKKP